MKFDPAALAEVCPPALADVTLQLGAVPEALPQPSSTGVLWQVAERQFLLSVPRAGRFLVADGRAITVDPLPGADPAWVLELLAGTPLAALWGQRGGTALHAAAVAPPGDELGPALLLAGISAAGKSTLAMALVQRGWRLLADDLALLDLSAGKPQVLPTSSSLALWPDSAQRLGLATSGGRQRLVVGPAGARAARPVYAIVHLVASEEQSLTVALQGGAAALQSLALLAYNNHICEALVGSMGLLQQAIALASALPVYQIERVRHRWCLEELVAAVEVLPHG